MSFDIYEAEKQSVEELRQLMGVDPYVEEQDPKAALPDQPDIYIEETLRKLKEKLQQKDPGDKEKVFEDEGGWPLSDSMFGRD